MTKEKIKAAVCSARGKDSFTPEQCLELEKNFEVSYIHVEQVLEDKKLVALLKEFPFIAITRRLTKNLNRNILEQLSCLKGISLYSTGTEWVDMEYLNSQGVLTAYLKDYSAQTVAEQALAMLFMLSRRILISYPIAEGWLNNGISQRGWELQGKIAGILGVGEIGFRLAKMLSGIGMQVIFHDIDNSKKAEGKAVGFTELLTESDALFLCTPQERNREALINLPELSQMKKKAVLVNPSRAGLVNHYDLLEHLRHKKLAGYALDDTLDILKSPEGIEPGRILQTGHTGWYSNEAMERGTQCWIENLITLKNKIIKEDQ